MSSAVRGAHRPEGILENREDFLHAVAQLQACHLKLTGKMPHIFTSGAPSFPQCPQHRENLALRAEAGMKSIMDPFESLLVGTFEGIVSAHVERGNHCLARQIL